jgi:hypothetical protein
MFFFLIFAFPAVLFGSIKKYWIPDCLRSTYDIKRRFGAVFEELRMDRGFKVLL